MAEILTGRKAALSIDEKTRGKVSDLLKKGVRTQLAVVRVGEKEADLFYERGICKRAETVGIKVRIIAVPEETGEAELLRIINGLNEEAEVHGILLFCPLPKSMDEKKVVNAISPQKDVDGVTDSSAVGVYAGTGTGYPPCTADAVVRILDCYGFDPAGKRAVIIGRSLVVGKPLAMMLLKRNATVTICHTKTANLPEVTKEADLLVAAAGHIGTVTGRHVRGGQTVIDVGINTDKDGKMTGDVLFEEVEPFVGALTPVPGGVGSVTVSVLLYHTAEAAEKESVQ